MRRPSLALPMLLPCLAGAGAAQAFGTINAAHQSAEHEMITRRALACAGPAKPDNGCFEANTIAELAGAPGRGGAVGYPDLSSHFFTSQAHCDNGDMAGALAACRAWMEDHMRQAVADAARLLDAQGRVDPGQVSLGCVYAFNLKGRAKCNVLQDLGLTLHAAQDFYSHSNWVDSPADRNPTGLGFTGPAPFISLRTFPADPPAGLVSGCYSLGGGCGKRLNHADLNKDLGPISPVWVGPVGPGITPRGDHNLNFERAVGAASADTRDKWAVLRERLAASYGAAQGARMACALTRDDPVGRC